MRATVAILALVLAGLGVGMLACLLVVYTAIQADDQGSNLG